jgi:PAS domain S-box-containing protein
MNKNIRVVIIEKSLKNLKLITDTLKKGDLQIEPRQLSTLAELSIALNQFDPDVIILGQIKGFQGTEIQSVIQASGKAVPLIVVTKNQTNNPKTMQEYMGMTEFVSIDDLSLLVSAVRKAAQKDNQSHDAANSANSSEDSFHQFFSLFEQSPLGILILDPATFLPIEFNTTAHKQLGYARDEFKNISILDFDVVETKEEIEKHRTLILKKGYDSFDSKHRTKQGEIRNVHVTVQSVVFNSQTYLHCIFEDITERRKVEEFNLAERELLQICNLSSSSQDLLRKLLSFFKKYSGCDAVGIRLHKDVDFPYYKTSGFPEEFVQLENSLCAVDDPDAVNENPKSKPFLECMCGNVISGRYDPTKSFFTKHGSFWSGNTTQWFASTTEADRLTNIRNRCNTERYESVALIPIRLKDKTFGLIQFNDKRKDWHTLEKVEILEHLADYVAITLAKQEADEALAISEQSFKEIFNSTTEAIFIHDANTGQLLDVNLTMLKIYGFSTKEEALGKNISDLTFGEFPFTSDRAFDLIKKTVHEGPQIFVWLAKKKDGSLFWTEVTLNKSMIGGENRVLAVVRDISERKRMEEALNYSIERYRLLFEEMTEGFALHEIILDQDSVPIDYRFLDINPAFERQTGLKREALIGRTVKEVMPGTEDYWIEKYGQVALHGGNLHYENYSHELGKWFNVIAFCPKFGQFATMFEDITDRKINDLALKESEDQFRSTFEQTTIGMTMVTPDGQFLRVNDAYCQIVGYSPDELIGNNIKVVTYPDDMAKSEEYLELPLNTNEQSITFEKRYIHKDGHIVWVSLISTLIRDTNGNPKHFITQVQDITERRMVEEALQLRNKIFTHSLDMLFVAGFDGFFRELNPAWETNLGWSIEELYKKPWLNFVHPDDKEITENIKKERLEKGQETIQFENRYICKDGSIKWLSWNSFPYPEENIIIGVARDITERKELDESLRRSEDRFHLIDKATNDLISSYDLYGRFTHVNSALCKLMGRSYDEIVGKTFTELGYPREQYEEWGRLLQRVIKEDSTVNIEQKDSETGTNPHYFDVVLNPIHNEAGEVVGMAATSRDITSRKMAEAQIREQLEELRRWNALTMGRENRIMELKQEVNFLLQQLDQPPRYESVANTENHHVE